MNWWARLILALFVVVMLSEVAPEAVNWFLLLIIAGMVLAQASKYTTLLQSVFAVGKGD